MNFHSMTKAEIGAYGAQHRINLNEREMTKAEMIEAIEAALAEKASRVEKWTIEDVGQSPVIIYLAGQRYEFPAGISLPLTTDDRAVLDAVGVAYTKD